jgi:hypothetical protein
MGHRWLIAALVASLGVGAPAVANAGGERSGGGGKIEDARDGLDGDDDDDDDDDDSEVRDHRDSDDDTYGDDDYWDDDDTSSDDDSVGGLIIMYVFTSPWWIPAVAVEDLPWPRPYAFNSYPFEDGAPGPHTFSTAHSAEPEKLLSFRAMASYEDQRDGTVGQRLQVTARTNIRLNVDAEVTRYDEDLGGGMEDHLWHSKLTGTYSHAISPRAHFTTGIGFRHLRFAAGDHSYGWTLRYGMELFPVNGLHVWTMGELGANSGEFTAEWEVAAGYMLNRVELFAGYRLFRVVGVNFAGPEAGMAVWF